MNDLQIFSNPEFGRVRSIIIDDVIWFVGRDVADALGYVNIKDAIIRHVDEDDIRVGIPDPEQKEISQQAKLINETGVISLALMSELPSAKKFRRWITKEVIPSIMRTGSYNLPQLSQNELILQIAQSNVELEREVKELKQSQTTLDQKLNTAVQIFAASDKSWKETMEITLKEITGASTSASARFKGKLYQELEASATVDLQARLERRRKRMKKNGATYSECMAVNKMDIISFDKKLRPIFEGIVKKHQALYVAGKPSANERNEA